MNKIVYVIIPVVALILVGDNNARAETIPRGVFWDCDARMERGETCRCTPGIDANCYEIDTESSYIIQGSNPPQACTPTPGDSNCVANPNVEWNPLLECETQNTSGGGSPANLYDPSTWGKNFYQNILGDTCEMYNALKDQWDAAENKIDLFFSYFRDTMHLQDYITQFRVYDIGSNMCQNQKIRYLLGIEEDLSGNPTNTRNHPSKQYYIAKIRNMLFSWTSGRPQRVRDAYAEIMALMNRNICDLDFDASNRLTPEAQTICDMTVREKLIQDINPWSPVRISSSYMRKMANKITKYMHTNRPMNNRKKLIWFLNTYYSWSNVLADNEAWDRYGTYESKERVILDTYVVMALLHSALASSENISFREYSQTGIPSTNQKAQLPDCHHDLDSDYRLFFAPPCTCGTRGLDMFSIDFWFDELKNLMNDLQTMRAMNYSVMNLVMWQDGEYQGGDFLDIIYQQFNAMVDGVFYVLTLWYFDDGVSQNWTEEESEVFDEMKEEAQETAMDRLDELGYYINPIHGDIAQREGLIPFLESRFIHSFPIKLRIYFPSTKTAYNSKQSQLSDMGESEDPPIPTIQLEEEQQNQEALTEMANIHKMKKFVQSQPRGAYQDDANYLKNIYINAAAQIYRSSCVETKETLGDLGYINPAEEVMSAQNDMQKEGEQQNDLVPRGKICTHLKTLVEERLQMGIP